MTVEMRELYSSPNGDRWYLARDIDLGQVFIRLEPNLPSGGKAVRIEVGAFLSQSGRGPEHRELLRLIGTLAEPDHSFETGTAARIKSHAKSYIVELTDGSKWRIWPGDLATTLGWTSEAEIEVLPIEDEFCSHVLIDQSGGSRVVRLRRVTIGPLKNCASPWAVADDATREQKNYLPSRFHRDVATPGLDFNQSGIDIRCS